MRTRSKGEAEPEEAVTPQAAGQGGKTASEKSQTSKAKSTTKKAKPKAVQLDHSQTVPPKSTRQSVATDSTPVKARSKAAQPSTLPAENKKRKSTDVSPLTEQAPKASKTTKKSKSQEDGVANKTEAAVKSTSRKTKKDKSTREKAQPTPEDAEQVAEQELHTLQLPEARNLDQALEQSTAITPGDDEPDDDEAPEEVSLKLGKQTAELQLQAEKENRKLAKLSASKKRRREELPEAEEDMQNKGSSEDTALESADLQPGPDGEDLLPAEVIEALQKQAKQDRKASQQSQQARQAFRDTVDPDELMQQSDEPMLERQAGSVLLKVLVDKPSFKPSAAAMDFLKQKMYGSRLKRSREMLKPVKAGNIRTSNSAKDFIKGR